MSDLALGSDHDLALSADGNLYLTEGIPLAAAQRIAIRLSMYLGEWFLDQSAGVPYFQQILLDVPDESILRTIFRNQVLADPYVISVPRCDISIDRTVRALDVSFTAILIEGSEVSVTLTQGLVNGQITVSGIGIVVNGIPLVIG